MSEIGTTRKSGLKNQNSAFQAPEWVVTNLPRFLLHGKGRGHICGDWVVLSVRHERRVFLKSLAGLAVTGPVVARLELVEQAFGAELDTVVSLPRSTPAWEALRDRYVLGSDVVYLNHASIGTISRVVHEACVEYIRVCEENPWLYMWGGAWEEPRASVRAKAAALFGADADEVP